MKNFSLEEIGQKRESFQANSLVERFPAKVNGQVFNTFVLPSDWIPKELPFGVIRMTPDSETIRSTPAVRHPEITLFGISNNVRELVGEKGMWLMLEHEIYESTQIGFDNPEHCSLSARQEIDLASRYAMLTHAEQETYFGERERFFKCLGEYASQEVGSYTTDDLKEFENSRQQFEAKLVNSDARRNGVDQSVAYSTAAIAQKETR